MMRQPVNWLSALVIVAALVAGCDQKSESSDVASMSASGDEEFVWQDGTLDTRVVRAGPLAIRCFRVEVAFDCIVAQKHDLPASMPKYRVYYRAVLSALPRARDDLADLEVTDGYACRVRGRPGSRQMMEFIWSDRSAQVRRSREGTSDVPWNPIEIVRLLGPQVAHLRRPYFPCLIVDSEVYRSGLDGLDSPTLDHDIVSGESTSPDY